jgi:hypothetical protein
MIEDGFGLAVFADPPSPTGPGLTSVGGEIRVLQAVVALAIDAPITKQRARRAKPIKFLFISKAPSCF